MIPSQAASLRRRPKTVRQAGQVPSCTPAPSLNDTKQRAPETTETRPSRKADCLSGPVVWSQNYFFLAAGLAAALAGAALAGAALAGAALLGGAFTAAAFDLAAGFAAAFAGGLAAGFAGALAGGFAAGLSTAFGAGFGA